MWIGLTPSAECKNALIILITDCNGSQTFHSKLSTETVTETVFFLKNNDKLFFTIINIYIDLCRLRSGIFEDVGSNKKNKTYNNVSTVSLKIGRARD